MVSTLWKVTQTYFNVKIINLSNIISANITGCVLQQAMCLNVVRLTQSLRVCNFYEIGPNPREFNHLGVCLRRICRNVSHHLSVLMDNV